ncbi:MAG: type II toxin-antitoxin system HicB family antitoxin [Chromatiaceae bacterium]|nr:type II toxin-antitoxin system HicB family antitoxin [Chromatiaceae bacterium]
MTGKQGCLLAFAQTLNRPAQSFRRLGTDVIIPAGIRAAVDGLLGACDGVIRVLQMALIGLNGALELTIQGYSAVIAFDPDIGMFRGEFVGLNGGADFYAKDLDRLRQEGALSLRIFLDACAEDGVE